VTEIKKNFIKLGYRILHSRYFGKIFGSYRVTWELAGITKSTAMDAVWFNAKDEHEFWQSGAEEAERLRKFVSRSSVVLDVGCGLGRVEKYLAPYCKEINSVDISARMLRFAKNNLKEQSNVFLHRNNGKDLSFFPDKKFDFVFCLLVLQHLEKEDAFMYMKEIYRVLGRGRVACMQFPDFLSDKSFAYFTNYALEGSRHSARVRCYTEPEVRKILGFIGFEKIEISFKDADILVVASK